MSDDELLERAWVLLDGVAAGEGWYKMHPEWRAKFEGFRDAYHDRQNLTRQEREQEATHE